MTSTRNHSPLLGSRLVVNLLAGTILWSGCGSDVAGTIHIESSKARRQKLQTGASAAPAAAARLNPSGKPGMSVPRSKIKNRVGKKSQS
jgi:hypothetical protein